MRKKNNGNDDQKHIINDEEARVWAFATRDVKPLKSQDISTDTPALSSEYAPKTPKPPRQTPPPSSVPNFAKTTPQTHPGIGLDRRTFEKLRKGEIPIEAQIDLHGFRQDRAYAALTKFILQAHDSQKRCVLVITGKGAGILQNAVPLWLSSPPLDLIVLKSHPAQPRHGGEGAFYVYIARNRLENIKP